MKTPIKTNHALCGLMSTLLFTTAGTFTAHADLINEDFSSGTLPPTLQIASGTAVSFTGGAALFTGLTANDETSLRTVEADFYGQSFVAEVTFNLPIGAGFFGMGNGGLSAPPSLVGPLGPAIWLDMRNGSNWAWEDGAFPAASNGSMGIPLPGNGTFRVQLSWDSIAKTAVFAVDQNYVGGPFVADFTSPAINGADNGFTNTSTRIWFAGQRNESFDDFNVKIVPEPASAALLGLGTLLCAARRRRRAQA